MLYSLAMTPLARPEVRRDLALCFAALVAGFLAHSWIDAALIPRMAESLGAAGAANLGGAVAGALALGVALAVGWLGGGLLLRFRPPSEAAPCAESFPASRFRSFFDRYPRSRLLATISLLCALGVAVGHWALLGGLAMTGGISAGYWARAVSGRP